MLVCLTCTCSGSETLARKVLKKSNVADWMRVPIYQGKTNCMAWVNARKNLEGADILAHFIENNSVYVLIVGYTDIGLMFANVKNGSIKEEMEAEIIAEQFAKI